MVGARMKTQTARLSRDHNRDEEIWEELSPPLWSSLEWRWNSRHSRLYPFFLSLNESSSLDLVSKCWYSTHRKVFCSDGIFSRKLFENMHLIGETELNPTMVDKTLKGSTIAKPFEASPSGTICSENTWQTRFATRILSYGGSMSQVDHFWSGNLLICMNLPPSKETYKDQAEPQPTRVDETLKGSANKKHCEKPKAMEKKKQSFKKVLCSEISFSKEQFEEMNLIGNIEPIPTMVDKTFEGSELKRPTEAGSLGTKIDKDNYDIGLLGKAKKKHGHFMTTCKLIWFSLQSDQLLYSHMFNINRKLCDAAFFLALAEYNLGIYSHELFLFCLIHYMYVSSLLLHNRSKSDGCNELKCRLLHSQERAHVFCANSTCILMKLLCFLYMLTLALQLKLVLNKAKLYAKKAFMNAGFETNTILVSDYTWGRCSLIVVISSSGWGCNVNVEVIKSPSLFSYRCGLFMTFCKLICDAMKHASIRSLFICNSLYGNAKRAFWYVMNSYGNRYICIYLENSPVLTSKTKAGPIAENDGVVMGWTVKLSYSQIMIDKPRKFRCNRYTARTVFMYIRLSMEKKSLQYNLSDRGAYSGCTLQANINVPVLYLHLIPSASLGRITRRVFDWFQLQVNFVHTRYTAHCFMIDHEYVSLVYLLKYISPGFAVTTSDSLEIHELSNLSWSKNLHLRASFFKCKIADCPLVRPSYIYLGLRHSLPYTKDLYDARYVMCRILVQVQLHLNHNTSSWEAGDFTLTKQQDNLHSDQRYFRPGGHPHDSQHGFFHWITLYISKQYCTFYAPNCVTFIIVRLKSWYCKPQTWDCLTQFVINEMNIFVY